MEFAGSKLPHGELDSIVLNFPGAVLAWANAVSGSKGITERTGRSITSVRGYLADWAHCLTKRLFCYDKPPHREVGDRRHSNAGIEAFGKYRSRQASCVSQSANRPVTAQVRVDRVDGLPQLRIRQSFKKSGSHVLWKTKSRSQSVNQLNLKQVPNHRFGRSVPRSLLFINHAAAALGGTVKAPLQYQRSQPRQ